jgi:hypothetical protein
MAIYKISGDITEDALIYVIQDEEYKGKRRVSAGHYEIVFESESDSSIIAVAENSEGKILSFGNITVIDADGQTPNLHFNESLSVIINNLTGIYNSLNSLYDVSQDIIDDLDSVINRLRSI